jgi:hypothetical protein
MAASNSVVERISPAAPDAALAVERPGRPTRTVILLGILGPVLLGAGVVAAPFSGGASLGVAVLLLIALVAD